MNEKKRCQWGQSDNPLMVQYHDEEWGVPTHDDKTIFEFLVLESAQAGLSWQTILNKRAGYRKAFANFSPQKVAQFTTKDVSRLLKDSSIIRNRAKIEATIANAQAFLDVQKEHGNFASYIWSFVGDAPIDGKREYERDIPVTTDIAKALSKDLKKRGFRFLGPIVVYSHMQATGMVNDHVVNCFRYPHVTRLS